jgi:cytochrome c oxidase subunit 2
MGDLKFLEVDNRLILPVNYFLHFVLSSSDVIHSWALPSFFIKLDVLSGVITIFDFFFNLSGLFFGQCSEICGANHSFIPIVVELVLLDFFKIWVLSLS